MKITAKEFLQNKTLTAVGVARGTILNLVVQNSSHGLYIDTTRIPCGTPVVRIENFSIKDDILTVRRMSLDLSTTFML